MQFIRRGLVVAVLSTLCATAFAQTKTIKLGHPQSATSAFHAGAEVFAQEVDKLSKGAMKVQLFPGAILGGEREMVEAVQLGTLEVVVTSTGPVGNFVPETLITDIPFLFRDYDHARKTLDGQIGQDILAKFPSKGIVGLAWAENGFRHVTNSKKAVNTPEDLKGLKLRTMENPVHMLAFRTMGAQPTPMAFPEVFGALQQGIVDGQENPIPVIVSSKFGQVQKNLTLTGHVYSPALFITSTSFFGSLTADQKKIIQDSAKTGATAMRRKVNEIENKGIDDLKAQGVTVVSSVDKAKFQAALAPAYADYAKRFGADAIDKIKAVK